MIILMHVADMIQALYQAISKRHVKLGTCKLCRHSFGHNTFNLMPEQCWHNRDIFLPKFAIVRFINFLPNCPTKYIDHKAFIILHMCYLD